jgi:hypothetical protein
METYCKQCGVKLVDKKIAGDFFCGIPCYLKFRLENIKKGLL